MKDIALFKTSEVLYFKKVSKKSDLLDTNLDEAGGILIDTNCNEKELRRIIDSPKGKKLPKAVVGGQNVFNRRVLDTIDCKYLVSPENGEKKDNLKQRDSGLNHVTAKIAKDKGVTIVIDFSEVNSLTGKPQALRLSRIMQNIKICRKAGCQIKVATFAKNKNELRTPKELSAFMFSLGASSGQTKD